MYASTAQKREQALIVYMPKSSKIDLKLLFKTLQ
jgi:hypothetical protein